ncbi:carbohydrate-binding protein [Paenibacillus sp. V4I5]|uniref:carbohydrate-binding protein n=1 Tax=Paenibacillus sp. V4I5 TaxID=3042306 RepID=UPI00278ED94B|nr:carbohydrate-binding protein [Paenibacillus sp. V4I5]MDQ0920347.1 putative alpha-1,6-mannanase (GH76 family) [Paenibacillus sp. V4I5]
MGLKKVKPFKFIVLTLACSLSFTTMSAITSTKANAFTSSDAEVAITKANVFTSSDADVAIEAFNTKFWDSDAKYFWTNSDHGNNYQGFWVEAELWEMVMDAYVHTSDPSLKSKLRTQIDDIFDGTVAKFGEDWTNNHFNDDIMWWAMASARAYEITKEQRYLDKAKYYFDFVYDTQWDDNFANGGIWWLNSEHTTKNACINFPAAEAAVYMYNITQDEHYLDAASKIYRWGKTMLTDGNGKVYDRIEIEKGAVPDATHYNQGTFIGAAVGLYQITGNTVYLDDAVKAANFTQTHLVDANHLLRYEGPNGDLKGGKTILIRNLAYLQKAVNERSESAYKQFSDDFNYWLAFNTQMAWNNRNSDNIVDGNWAGQLLSGTYESWASSSAVEALTVIEPQDVTINYAAKNPYNTIEAESYNVGTGFILEGSSEGTLQLGGIQSGFFAAYKNVDFGSTGAIGFIARAASGTDGGNIEIRLDSLNGPKVGTLNVEGTGGWNNYTDAVTLLKDDQGNQSTVTGKHDVYLAFTKTKDQYLFNLNSFKFTTTDPTKTDAYARLKAGNFDSSSGLSKNAEWGFIDGIKNNAYASYKGIDFGSGAAGVTAHVTSGNQGGTIEIKLDSLNGPTVGVIGIPALGNWNNWVDIMSNIDDTKAVGVHDVYLVFHGTNGSDSPCNLDWFTFTTVKGKARDAYGKLEAENYTSGVGFGTENGGEQTYLAGIYGPNNPYAMYNYVDFGSTSPSKFHVNAASDTGGGTIELRMDSMNGPVIATSTVTGTGGWQKFKVFSADVTTPITGKHIVFMLFKGGDWLYNFDKFTFGDPAVFTAPTPPPVPVKDNVPPGNVENIQVISGTDSMKLLWDGPYDIDGQKVQITLLSNGQQVGSVIDVNRGIQTAVLPGIQKGNDFTILIKTIDTSGNVSQGKTIVSKDLPSFSLSANWNMLKEGDSFEDYMALNFKVWDNLSAIKSAQIIVDGTEYKINPQTMQSIDIDMAGNLGDKTTTVAIEDAAGNKLQNTFHVSVTTSVYAMEHLITRFTDSGELSGAVIPQLTNALKQVQHQLEIGKQDNAIKHMQDFIKHLNNEALRNNVKDSAKAILNTDAQSLITTWQKVSSK